MDEDWRPDGAGEFLANETHDEAHGENDDADVPLAVEGAEDDADDEGGDPHIDVGAEFTVEEATEEDLLCDRSDDDKRDEREDVVAVMDERGEWEGLLLVGVDHREELGEAEEKKAADDATYDVADWREEDVGPGGEADESEVGAGDFNAEECARDD